MHVRPNIMSEEQPLLVTHTGWLLVSVLQQRVNLLNVQHEQGRQIVYACAMTMNTLLVRLQLRAGPRLQPTVLWMHAGDVRAT